MPDCARWFIIHHDMDNAIELTGWMPLLLVGVGLFVGMYGTMAGIGGGVVLVPLLILIFQHVSPGVLTGISLAVVLLNSTSGTLAYARQRRIDYKNGLIFAMATIPGTILGVWTLNFISMRYFSIIFAVLMLAVAAFIILHPQTKQPDNTEHGGKTVFRVIDKYGQTYTYSFNRWLGIGFSLLAGFLSGLMGIGGGILHVPVMVYILGIPVHVATATSHFILIFTALSGVFSHLAMGTYLQNWPVILWLALGVIPGAQLGARLSRRIHGQQIVRLLALALVILGIRLMFNI